MDYFAIIKKSYQITLKHKFSWIFGILAGGGSYGALRGYPSIANLFESDIASNATSNEFNIAGISPSIIIFMLVIGLTIGLIFFILNIISQGALVEEFSEVEKGNKINFKQGIEAGWSKFWRVFSLNLIMGLAIFVSVTILILPVATLVIAKIYVLAIILGILLFLLCLFFWIIMGLIYPYSLRMVVLEKKGIFETIRESLHFVRNNFVDVIVMYLISYAIGLGYGLVMLFAIVLLGLILLAIGFALFLANPIVAVIYGLTVGFVFLCGLIIVGGAYQTFNFGIITLTYLKLKNKS